MRTRLCAAVLLLTTAFATADAQPNPLAPKDAGDGWLLLFDGETTFGWHVQGEARVEHGVLILGGSAATTATTTTAFPNWCCSCELETRWEGSQPPTFSGPLNLRGAGLTDGSKGKFVRQSLIHNRPPVHFRPPPPTPWRFEVPAGSQLLLRNVKLKHAALESIFNGKDLSGWTIHPDKKSQFTVSDGILTVKDGPGDLQTERQWADFFLQFDCKSNGKHLNSGLFFRCLPGKYQQGYEAQVRNQFTAEPTQEYTIEEYDPQTHQLKEKHKAKYTAVDYGTGAIYRRMPARKEASKDNEWFTMTVIADGRHVATWVNGIQVVDWTDNRPLNENARNGCRLEPGALSLQGHDPTTDLSFRNFRIADLRPKAKSEIPNPKSQIRKEALLRIWDLGFGIWDFGFRIWDFPSQRENSS